MKEIIELKEKRKRFLDGDMFGWINPPRILVIGFFALIIMGAILLSLPLSTADGQGLAAVDALFTATSALCVTGLVVADTGTTFTVYGQMVILFLIQVGGIGFMTFATLFAIILGRRITLKERLLLQEALNQISLEGIVRLARYIILVSLAIEGIGAFILTINWQREMGFVKAGYYGIFHAVSGFNNAGFDLFGNYSSLTSRTGDFITNLTMMFLIITGGIGFAVLSDLYTSRGHRLSLHSRLVIRSSLFLILAGSALIFLLELTNPATLGALGPADKTLAAVFQSVTTRTAGFNTIDTASLRNSTQIIIMLLMFIGASPGSTGGGIKTTTFTTIALSVIATFKGKCSVVWDGRSLPKDIVQKAIAVTVFAVALIFVVVLALSLTEESDLMTLLFETISAFGTVGLSLGITPKLSAAGKVLIIIMMFCGRLGPLTLAFALSQKQKQSALNSQIKYPEEKIIIG